MHTLDRFGGGGSGYGKPYRGLIEGLDTPKEGKPAFGFIEAGGGRTVTIRTSPVLNVRPIADAPDIRCSVIETLNSVYVVRYRPE